MDPRQGKQTSEFWLTIAIIAAALLNGTEMVNIPWDQFIWIAGLAGVYTVGRSYVKGKNL